MKQIPPQGHISKLEALGDASLGWLENLSLNSLSPEVRHHWEGLLDSSEDAVPHPKKAPSVPAPPTRTKEIAGSEQGINALIRAHRYYGHLAAGLDPLKLRPAPTVPELDPGLYGLADPEMLLTPDALGIQGRVPLHALLQTLQQIYCDTMALELSRDLGNEKADWLFERYEQHVAVRAAMSSETRMALLERLTAAQELELYLGRRYPGAKRFGLEGAESLIPALDAMLQTAASEGAKEICMGMAHRGRLNVLVNLLGKPASELFNEFDGTAFTAGAATGDVKYHQGFSSGMTLQDGSTVHLALSFNPSHLEAVGPVVTGSVRARQDRRDGNNSDGRREVVPILIHGDAAFSGQGIVMETLQMSQTPAYGTGGTVHLVINNQIGYTTSNPEDARSTRYCTDIGRMVLAPVLHVNADDPEAVHFAASLAMEYRYRFGCDIVLDLVCFRRLGHNEADEPSATQPLMYRAVREHPGTRNLYAGKLMNEGFCDDEKSRALISDYRSQLEQGVVKTPAMVRSTEPAEMFDWTPYLSADRDETVKTALDREDVRELSDAICRVPDNFVLQRQVERLIASRHQMLSGEKPLDWGCAEMLTYGSLLRQGYPLRFTGQDSRRGTFAHRHFVLFDQQTGAEHVSLLQVASDAGVNLSFYDSFLSEAAVLGFEYGYSATWPVGLVVWEAQFGDFANGAQVIIDQFVVSGQQKWQRLSGLTLLLPHGHEGQGPEHSSARLERFLQLCARNNMQVCVPSTPAQQFHLLRRQAIRPSRHPLIVMTPKSLLRLSAAASPLQDFMQGGFLPVMDDDSADVAKVRRIVLCSGRIYYPLVQRRQRENITDTAIVRLEQLYPFPYEELTGVLARYGAATELVWCQEDPSNQGAWHQMMHRFYRVIDGLERPLELISVTRESAAAPAVGWAEVHRRQEEMIERQALPSPGDNVQ